MLLRLFSNAMRQALIFVEIFWDKGRSGISANVGKMPKIGRLHRRRIAS
jgi:hypothetical protein